MKFSTTIAAAIMAIAVVTVNAEHASRRLTTGGQLIENGSKTYTVGVRETIDGESYCGGVLVAPLFVLTTKECVNEKEPKFVSVGTHYISQRLDGEQISVVSVHFHPKFNPTLQSYDFVLLELAKPSTYNAISLPKADDSDIQTNMTATAMSWGTSIFASGNVSKVLLGVKLRVRSFEECNALLRIDKTSVCAGSLKGENTCINEDGGPLVKEQGEGDKDDILIGIIRLGGGCGLEEAPVFFSRVSSALQWINYKISSN